MKNAIAGNVAFKNTACANKLCRLNCFPSVRSNRSMDICVLLMNSSRFYWRCDVLQAKYIIHVVYEICRCWEAVLPCTSNMHNENLGKFCNHCFFFFHILSSAVCLTLTCFLLQPNFTGIWNYFTKHIVFYCSNRTEMQRL